MEVMQNMDWVPAADELPAECKDVLFVTRMGRIYKGFLNLAHTWIINNADGLTARYFKNDNDVTGWMELPEEDAGWETYGNKKPEENTRVLTRDKLTGKVFIVYVYSNVWVIRNMPDDHITFSIWPKENELWMPLPKARTA